jgi:hypothetical protein
VKLKVEQSRILLTLDHRQVISAKYYFYLYDDSGNCCGVSVQCDDEISESFVVEGNPTFADYYEIQVSDDASYQEKKRAVLEATGWEFEDEFGWLKTDEDGEVIPGTDTNESITAWLRRPLLKSDSEYDRELYYSFGARSSTQYAPGFMLLEQLPKRIAQRLGVREAGLGGPASTVPCVVTSASIDELNMVIEKLGLPFIFVDDEGSEEI